MDVNRHFGRTFFVSTRESAVEFSIHVLAACLLLLAELLSALAAHHFVDPVAESMPSTYLAMRRHAG